MNSEEIVFVVDDEPDLTTALSRLLKGHGFTVRTFNSAASFLAECASDQRGCVILDIAMPGLGGLDLQRQLAERNAALSIVFLTGQGDIPRSVRAFKDGAVDFLLKPVDEPELLRAVRAALARARVIHSDQADQKLIERRYAQLTDRQRAVFAGVIAGKLNKQIAADLGVGLQTVKVHRKLMMHKMGAPSVAQLTQMASKLGKPLSR